jgi:hypothetical protein
MNLLYGISWKHFSIGLVSNIINVLSVWSNTKRVYVVDIEYGKRICTFARIRILLNMEYKIIRLNSLMYLECEIS